jgi:hypothetical protein
MLYNWTLSLSLPLSPSYFVLGFVLSARDEARMPKVPSSHKNPESNPAVSRAALTRPTKRRWVRMCQQQPCRPRRPRHQAPALVEEWGFQICGEAASSLSSRLSTTAILHRNNFFSCLTASNNPLRFPPPESRRLYVGQVIRLQHAVKCRDRSYEVRTMRDM